VIGGFVDPGAGTLAAGGPLAFDSATPPRRTATACGTAYLAALTGKYWFERQARLPVDVDIASEFRYRQPPLQPGGLALFISQSAETADTLAPLRYCAASGRHIPTMSKS